MIGIPLSYSIADGLALGFISYPIIKLFSGKGRDVGWLNLCAGGGAGGLFRLRAQRDEVVVGNRGPRKTRSYLWLATQYKRWRESPRRTAPLQPPTRRTPCASAGSPAALAGKQVEPLPFFYSFKPEHRRVFLISAAALAAQACTLLL